MIEAGGDFDYYNGNHMRNIDNLVAGVIYKFKNRDFIDYVHICPTAVIDVLGTAKAGIEVYESCKELGKPFMMICQDVAECHEAIILLRDHGIPAYSTAEQAVDAMIALYKYGQRKKQYPHHDQKHPRGAFLLIHRHFAKIGQKSAGF